MAIYHCSIKTGGRAKGQSAVAASAYRSGKKLTDKETGIISDYTRKQGIVHSEVSLCTNAPAEYADREKLWNAVHEIEKSSNARLWREIEVALPLELSRTEQVEVVRAYVKGLTDKGMCADWSIHDKSDGNPHAHIMLTTRSIEANGKWASKSRKIYDLDENGQKIPLIDKNTGVQKVDSSNRKQWKNHKESYNDWDENERVEEWREAWANVCNKYLSSEKRIDHRSYERQGIEQEPTIHEGYVARQIKDNGGTSDRCEINREIRQKNNLLQMFTEQLKSIAQEIKELTMQKGSVINDRIGELLKRRAAAKYDRGIADGERAIEGAAEQQPTTDTRAAIENLRATIADSRAAVADDDSEIRNRQAKEESIQRERDRVAKQETERRMREKAERSSSNER
jgi:hypothetical protein